MFYGLLKHYNGITIELPLFVLTVITIVYLMIYYHLLYAVVEYSNSKLKLCCIVHCLFLCIHTGLCEHIDNKLLWSIMLITRSAQYLLKTILENNYRDWKLNPLSLRISSRPNWLYQTTDRNNIRLIFVLNLYGYIIIAYRLLSVSHWESRSKT